MPTPLADYFKKHDNRVGSAYFDEIRKAIKFLAESEYWTRQELLEHQKNLAVRVAQHAAKYVPLYRELYKESQIEPSWESFKSLPVLTRKEYGAATHESRLSTWAPEDGRAATYAMTSGTTGAPIHVGRTLRQEAWRNACVVREFAAMDLNPSWRAAVCRVPISPLVPGWKEEIGGIITKSWLTDELTDLIGLGQGVQFDVGQPLSKVASAIRSMNPEIFHGTPTYFQSIFPLLKGYVPKVIITMSEQLFPAVRKELESSYQCSVVDLYASVELNRIGMDLGDGMIVHDENVLIEVIDDDGNPVKEGETGHAVATALHNYATPFVRYEIGDMVELGHSEGPRMKLAAIHGRQVSRIKLGEGRFRVATSAVIALLETPGMSLFQVRQTALDSFKVLMVGRDKLTENEQADIIRKFSQLIEQPAKIDFEPVDKILSLPNGKTPRLVVDF